MAKAPLDDRAQLRLPAATKESFAEAAAEQGRSFNAQLVWLMDAWLKAGAPTTIKAAKKAKE